MVDIKEKSRLSKLWTDCDSLVHEDSGALVGTSDPRHYVAVGVESVGFCPMAQVLHSANFTLDMGRSPGYGGLGGPSKSRAMWYGTAIARDNRPQ